MNDAPRSAAAFAAWMRTALVGAAVRRLDVPEPDLVVVTLHVDRRDRVLVLSAADGAAGIGIVERRPIGAPAGAFAGLLRKHLEGARVVDVEARASGAVGLVLRRADATAELVMELARRGSVVLLLDAASRVLGGGPASALSSRGLGVGAHYAPSERTTGLEWPGSERELEIAGASLLESRRVHREEGREAGLERALKRERVRLERRARAISNDLAKTEKAAALRADATAILAALPSIPPRSSEVELEDPESGERRRIELDPSLAPAANANALFQRARKLDRGRGIASVRLRETELSLAELDAALEALGQGETAPAERLARPERDRSAPSRTKAPIREPFRRYRSTDGTEILVGRGAKDNDRLTFGVARPHDLWLHVRGRSGSHVVLRCEPSRKPAQETVEDAALLAAHFSSARNDTAADVLCLERRTVRKPKGAAPGSVVADGAGTVRVRLDPERIERLLASES